MTIQQAQQRIQQRVAAVNSRKTQEMAPSPLAKAQQRIQSRVAARGQRLSDPIAVSALSASDVSQKVYGPQQIKAEPDSPKQEMMPLDIARQQAQQQRKALTDSMAITKTFLHRDVADSKTTVDNSKPSAEMSQPVYGPQIHKPKYDMGDKTTDNLVRSDQSRLTLPAGNVLPDIVRETELTALYRSARDQQGKRFLRVEGGIDFSKVPDYETWYSLYMQMQTQDGKPLTANQKKCYTAAFAVAMYDEMYERYKQDGGYDPYLYLAFSHFMVRMANGDMEGIDFDTKAFALAEVENYTKGKTIATDIADESLAVKLLFGYGFKATEAMEAIGNLSDTLSGKVTPVSMFGTAYNAVGETLDGWENTAYTVSGTLGNMTPYMLIGGAGASAAGYAVMFSQSLSSSMNGALREGYGYEESLGYGVASATMEVALNKVLGATGGALGKSAVGDAASALFKNGLAKLSAEPLVKKLVTIGGERLAAGAGEGLEERLQVYGDALLRNVFLDDRRQLNTVNEEAVYNGWIGYIVGVLLGNGNTNANTAAQLLSGTAAENLEIVRGLCDASGILSLTDAQRNTVSAMSANAEKLSSGNGGDAHLLQSQVQSTLDMWNDPLALDSAESENYSDREPDGETIVKSVGEERGLGLTQADEVLISDYYSIDTNDVSAQETESAYKYPQWYEKKKRQLQKNKKQGVAYENRIALQFKLTHLNSQKQITIKTSNGTRIRVDFIGYDPKTRKIVIEEAKSSSMARFTKNQIRGFPNLIKEGGVVVGKGKGKFKGGTVIPPQTDIFVRRPNEYKRYKH